MKREITMSNENEYIPYIRKYLGHEKIIAVGLCCLIVNENNEILLEQRSDNKLYCLPGGALNFNETVIEGLKREVKEETSIDLDEVKLFMVLSGEKEEFLYPNGDLTSYVDLIFISYVDSRKIKLDKKHDDESLSIQFYARDRLPSSDKLLRGTERILNKFLTNNLEIEID